MSTLNEKSSSSRGRDWSPHLWEGCHFVAWARLLLRNRFAVGLPYWWVAVIVTFVSFCHTLLTILQDCWYGPQIRRTRVCQAPIFIIGHWRTGTTLLHEFMILDERHSYPNTYQCLEPNHFLMTEDFFTRFVRFLTPTHRPMDNMKAGWTRPQEDEFALCMLGLPSPYLTIAFPNRPPQYSEYLDLEGLSLQAIARWKRIFYRFLQTLTFRDPRRLVLKSPPHSCRIKTLLEIFPDARFVHIVRDPFVVFPSTVNLWKSLYRKHGLQTPTFAGLEEYVFATFNRLYRKLEEGIPLIPPGRFHQVRYEDLVHDPIGEMEKLYDQLGLGEFEEYVPRLKEYLADNAGYETNRYELTLQQRVEIARRWGPIIRRYGYEKEPVARPIETEPMTTDQAKEMMPAGVP
jgi:hypothetical protein